MGQNSFQEVMKQWNRMCNAVPDKAESIDLCSNKKSGYVCPLREKGLCNLSIGAQSIEDWEEVEHIIMAWAAENPEPVYPTWYEYLTDMYPATWNMIKDKPIPSEIAQMLGIEPVPIVHSDCGATNETDARKMFGLNLDAII